MFSRGLPAKGNKLGGVACAFFNDAIRALTDVCSDISGVSAIAARTGFKSTYAMAVTSARSSYPLKNERRTQRETQW